MEQFFESRHEYYHKFLSRWRFHLDSYEGGEEYLEGGYLFRHFREHEEDYDDRTRRSYYYNFCRAVVDTYVSQIYHQSNAIYRDSRGHREFEQFLGNVDGRGSSMQVFMQETVAPAVQVFGHVHLLMDKPVVNRIPKSRAEEQFLNISPYLVMIYPEHLLDYETDSKGDFVWLRFREPVLSEGGPFNVKEPGARWRYRTWTTDRWYLNDDKGGLIATGSHPLGRVPAITVYNIQSRRYPMLGVSALADIAPINRSIFNWCSLNDEFLYRQCFNILAIPESPGHKVRKVGTTSALTFPYDAVQTPFYIYPPVEPGEYLLRNINDAVTQIYRIALLGTHELSGVRQVQSGLSKAYDYLRASQNIARKARNLEKAEMEIASLWALWENKLDYAPVINYPPEFNIGNLAEQLKSDFEVIQMNISETLNRTLKKRIATRSIGPGGDELIRIKQEIMEAETADSK